MKRKFHAPFCSGGRVREAPAYPNLGAWIPPKHPLPFKFVAIISYRIPFEKADDTSDYPIRLPMNHRVPYPRHDLSGDHIRQ